MSGYGTTRTSDDARFRSAVGRLADIKRAWSQPLSEASDTSHLAPR